MQTISILGTGWLGLPLAEHFVGMGCDVNVSTTSQSRLPAFASMRVTPFVIDIGKLPGDIQAFFQADLLIVNIPSKNIEGFCSLISEIEKSDITKVILVSSTSVIDNDGRTKSTVNPLLKIENLFRNSVKIKTTVLRFAGLIGYSRNPGKFFGDGKIVQNPETAVNLIHRDDCIGLISRIVEKDVWGELFNGCADTHPTKREFYTYAATSQGLCAPAFASSNTTLSKIVSNQKIKQVLNYEFLHPNLMKLKF